MTNITKFPDRRLERLAALVNSLRSDPVQAKSVAYADLLVALTEAYEAADQYATEHNLSPSPSEYLKEYTSHA